MQFPILATLLLVSFAASVFGVPYGGYGGKSIISSGGGRGHGGYSLGWYGGGGGHGNYGGNYGSFGGYSGGNGGPSSYKSYLAIADKYLDNDGQHYTSPDIHDGYGGHETGEYGYGNGDYNGGYPPSPYGQVPTYYKK